MAKYRKKPVVIEAWQITPNDDKTRQLPPPWLMDAMVSGVVVPNDDGTLVIKTPEGDHLGSVGDFVIQGVKGELYPCKPDIFAATYEEVV